MRRVGPGEDGLKPAFFCRFFTVKKFVYNHGRNPSLTCPIALETFLHLSYDYVVDFEGLLILSPIS